MIQSEKFQALIDDCISKIADEEKEIYRQIAKYAIDLGYTPQPVKNAHGSTGALAFTKNKVRRRLCKISPPSQTPPNGKELYRAGKTILSLSFYATPIYSELFHRGVAQELASLRGNYTGCYGCKHCTGGYTYVYPDGKTAICCGSTKLIELPPISVDHVAEVERLMKKQDEHFLEAVAQRVREFV